MGFFGIQRQDKRGRWLDVIGRLMLVVILYLGIRWITIEPYVIPSGSMKPTLLIEDYVVVNKWTYGLRLPFSKTWLFGPQVPSRGDVVVFRSVSDPDHFMVKRVVGLPGETISMDASGEIRIDEEPLLYTERVEREEDYLFTESLRGHPHPVKYSNFEDNRQRDPFVVPQGHVYVMGDNRDHSMDSRYWGALPLENLLGRASLIWMSCEENIKISSFLCAPEFFRRDRIFSRIR